MKKWYQKDNGKTIIYGESKEITKNHPSAKVIPDKPAGDFIWEGGAWIAEPDAYKRHREAEYPRIGDQLDAILKHMNYMQMTMGRNDISTDEKVLRSLNMIAELDGVIANWLSVKAKYPKPGA